jgi:metallo-beta-lactamase class B
VPYPIQLIPGVALLGGLEPGAAYAVETEAGLVLVDTGLASDASELKAQMARLNLDWKDTRGILLTHAHLDHSGGAEHLRAQTGAKVYAGAGEAAVLRAGAPREAFYSAFTLPGGALHRTTVDVELRGGELLDFGDVQFRAIATPGHTWGSVCYVMERKGVRVLFGGDVISMLAGDEAAHLRTWKPLGTYSVYLPPRYRGDAASYLSSLRALRALPVPDLVLPGHPRADPTPQDPRVSQERWHAMLDSGIAEMTTLVARYAADGADFLDGTPKQLLPDLCYLGDFQGYALYGLFAGSRFILVDAPGGAGLTDFVQASLLRLGRQPVQPGVVLLTSCGASAIAGLQALLAKTRAVVVAAAAGHEAIRTICPPGTLIHAAEDLATLGWLSGRAIPLRGRGIAPVAYQISWADKSVLITGEIPVNAKPGPEAELYNEISKTRDLTLDYLVSVHRLSDVRPDLWLTARPVDGQNANLYDDEWREILAENYRLGYRSLTKRR